MLVPDSQSCGYQFSSTSPLSPATVAASNAKTQALQLAVANAQTASDALLVANPWESWRGGFNLMKDIQRGNSQTGALPTPSDLPGAPGSGSQLPGLPPAGEGGSLWDRFKRNLAGPGGYRGGGRGPGGGSQFVPDGTTLPTGVGPVSPSVSPGTGWRRVPGGWVWPTGANGNRSGNARPDIVGWDSRFVTGPGGKFSTWPPGSNGALGSSTVATVKGWRRGRRGWVRDGVPGRGGSGRGAHARGGSSSWPYGNSIFGDGAGRPGNCGVIDCAASDAAACASEAADVVPSDGIMPAGARVVHSAPPPNPSLRTDQPDNIVVEPPFGYSAAISVPQPTARAAVQRGGMGEWTNSLAHPGAIPADCSTMGGGKAPVSVPWWLWVLGGVVLVAAVSEETKTRKSVGAAKKKAT